MHFLVAFVSREESQETLALAVRLAAALQSDITVVKMLADPHSVGVVAELIATDEPFILAAEEVQSVVDELITEDINVTADVRQVDEVGKGIVTAALELGADMVFLGTRDVSHPAGFMLQNDPVAHYVIERCPASVVLVRRRAQPLTDE